MKPSKINFMEKFSQLPDEDYKVKSKLDSLDKITRVKSRSDRITPQYYHGFFRQDRCIF